MKHPIWYDRLADKSGTVWFYLAFFGAIFLAILPITLTVNGVASPLALLLTIPFTGLSAVFWRAGLHEVDRLYPTVSDCSRCQDFEVGEDILGTIYVKVGAES